MSRHPVRLAAILAAIACAAQPAWAMGSFTPESAAVWVQRANSITAVALASDTTSDNMGGRFKDACKGLTGEVMKYGNHIPTWAQQSQFRFCSAADGLTNPLFRKSMCKELKVSIGALKKANPAKDPAEVVEAAGLMLKVADTMLSGLKQNHGC